MADLLCLFEEISDHLPLIILAEHQGEFFKNPFTKLKPRNKGHNHILTCRDVTCRIRVSDIMMNPFDDWSKERSETINLVAPGCLRQDVFESGRGHFPALRVFLGVNQL